MRILLLLPIALLAAPLGARGAELVLNEANAVSATKWLNGGDASGDDDGGLAADATLGRVQGNGGDWFELVVVADHLDVRGWTLEICDNGVCDEFLVFSSDPLWSDLRAGTLITVAEDQPEDASYDPGSGDWWINVRAHDLGTGTYITANSFPVSNQDWEITIKDDGDQTVFGPAGEFYAGVGVGSTEIFELEAVPTAWTSPSDPGYDDGSSSSTFGLPNQSAGGAAIQDLGFLRGLIPFPDRDGDGVFDDGDLSGVVGDAPCTPGQSAGCDDNCPVEANAGQGDSGGIGGPGANGVGDACECGDVDGDGDVDAADDTHLRELLASILPAVNAPGNCGVVPDGACTIADRAVTRRALAALAPGVASVCPNGAIPEDETDLLFDPDRVLDVQISMAPADWDALRFQFRDVAATLGPGCFDGVPPNPYTFFNATVTIDGQALPGSGVRKKGFFGSADFIKPALKVDFGEFAPGQTYLGMDRLTLNNAKQDPSRVKQCLAYDLFRKAGLAAPRCNFATVSVNGQPLGIYANVESIKEPFLSRVFGDSDGNLYEGALSDFRPTWVNTFEKKTNEQVPDRSDLDAVVTALEAPDATLEAGLDAIVDLDEFYTFWAMEALLAHWDGYHSNRNNFWIYFDPADGRMRFIVWGIDAVFAGGSPFAGGPDAHPMVFPRGHMARRLYLNTPTQASYIARALSLLDTVWDESELHAEVDRMEALLLPLQADLTTQLTGLRSFIDGRRAEVLAELGGTPPPWTAPLDDAECLIDDGDLTATFNTTWQDPLNTATFDPGSLSVTLGGQAQSFGFQFSHAGVEAGTTEGVVRVVGLPTVGNLSTIANVMIAPELVAPGIVDLGGFLSFLIKLDLNDPNTLQIEGLLMNTTITFSAADATPGAPVVGTIEADIGTGSLVTGP